MVNNLRLNTASSSYGQLLCLKALKLSTTSVCALHRRNENCQQLACMVAILFQYNRPDSLGTFFVCSSGFLTTKTVDLNSFLEDHKLWYGEVMAL